MLVKKIKIFGLGGSLRQGSFTKALLYAAKELTPGDAELEIYERLGEISLFDQDQEKNPPEIIRELKAMIKQADAILISSPEYNYTIPGYLKNAIDWASRPYGDNSFEDKPVAVMGGGGLVGGARVQYHLRQMFVFLNMHPINKPEVIIPAIAEKVKDGKVVDNHTRDKISELLTALINWTKRLNQG